MNKGEDQPATALPLPFDLDKAAVARDIHGNLNYYVTLMDTKASAFLAGNVAAAGFLLHGLAASGWVRWAGMASVAVFALSTIVAGGVIFPRLPRSGSSVLFWGDIARQGDPAGYVRDFNRVLDAGLLDEQYCVQNYYTALVIRRKYRWLRWAIVLFFIALFIGSVVLVAAQEPAALAH